jgi:hypothetical protein
MAIVTRLGKGSKLTIEEMDNNLLSLETDISGNVSSITSKLDKGSYTGSAKDLENAIISASTGASGISIVPTSPAPTGTGIASFTATQAGTYTNYGGVVVAANSFAIISRSAAGVFSISQTALDLSLKADKTYVDTNIANQKKTTKEIYEYLDLSAVTFSANQYILDFTLTAFSGIKATSFIAVTPNTKYNIYRTYSQTIQLSYFSTAAYTAGSFISRVNGASLNSIEITTPSEANFIIVNLATVNDNFYITKDNASNFVNTKLTAVAKEKIVGIQTNNDDLMNGAVYGDAGFYISNGVLLAFSGASVSGFIRVNPLTFYYLNNTSGGAVAKGCFFDSKQKFISNITKNPGTTGVDFEVTSPSNAYFVKLNKFNPTLVQLTPSISYNNVAKFNLDWLRNVSQYSTEILPTSYYSFNMINQFTFIGSFSYVIKKLIQAKNGVRFGIVSHYSKDTRPNMYKAQKFLADYWSVPFIDLGNTGFSEKQGINLRTALISDGIHPALDYNSTTGRSENVDRIAATYAQQIKLNFGDITGKRVATYGTSIPAGNPPAGGEDNKQYPKVAIQQILGGINDNYSIGGSVIRTYKSDGITLTGRSSFSDDITPNPNNYQTLMVNKFGTANEPFIVLFDFGYNDFDSDSTDINEMDFNTPLR